MAQRRMFSSVITSSARFVKMPHEAQALYFHLGIHADDDGVVEAFPIMRILGSAEDNLKILAAKQFIRVLNEDLVSLIMDWCEHNLIRSDRKKDSIYKDLLLQEVPGIELIEATERADSKNKPTDSKRTSNGPHRLGKVRLGKVRLGKGSLSKLSIERTRKTIPPTLDEVSNYCKERKNNVVPDKFMDHYESNGWKVGKNRMVDWQAAVRKWETPNAKATSAEILERRHGRL